MSNDCTFSPTLQTHMQPLCTPHTLSLHLFDSEKCLEGPQERMQVYWEVQFNRCEEKMMVIYDN